MVHAMIEGGTIYFRERPLTARAVQAVQVSR
jgi:hypothetical protein